MHSARIARGAVASFVLGIGVFAVDACNGDDTAGDPSPVDDGGTPEASLIADAMEEAHAIRPRCATDNDCPAPNGCYTGHCDLVLGACAYALCEQAGRACSSGLCDVATSTCSDTQDYGMRATRYEIGGAVLGCAATNANDCFAALYPFAFIGTKTDVLVVRVDDLRAQAFTAVKHQGDPIIPARFVVSGRRLWILGAVQPAGSSFHLPLSWIDVPTDPTVTTSVAVESAVVTWPFATATAFAAPDDGLFIALNDATQGFPVARFNAPLAASPTALVENPADGGPPTTTPTNPMYRVNATPGALLAASSGDRVVVSRAATQVSFITGVGTPNVQLTGEQALQPTFAPLNGPRFAQGPDGTVLSATAITADPDCNCTTHQRLQWEIPNAIATNVDVNAIGDLEAYQTLQKSGGACHECVPVYVSLPSLTTWLDARTALFVAPASGTAAMQALPSIRVVTRNPIVSTPGRRFIPPATEIPAGNFASDRIGLASSNGFGYLLVSDATGTNVHLSIFDPRCDAN